MSSQQFVAWAEQAYGKYLPAMRMEVVQWLDGWTPGVLDALRLITLKNHPSVYGRPPGVHELEVMRREAVVVFQAKSKELPAPHASVADLDRLPDSAWQEAWKKIKDKVKRQAGAAVESQGEAKGCAPWT